MARDNALRLAASRMYLMREDVLTIQMLVERLDTPARNPLMVIDLGAGSGTTALAVLDVRDDARIVTVDIDQANLDWAGKAVRNVYPQANWQPMLQDAADTEWAKMLLHDVPLDLLLHDASHERAHVEADLRAWIPMLAPGALIWVHDWASPPQSWGQPDSPGVALAIQTLVDEGLLVTLGTDGLGWYGQAA